MPRHAAKSAAEYVDATAAAEDERLSGDGPKRATWLSSPVALVTHDRVTRSGRPGTNARWPWLGVAPRGKTAGRAGTMALECEAAPLLSLPKQGQRKS